MSRKLTQDQRLSELVEAFKADSGQYADIETPGDLAGRRRLLRSLMNIRMPGSMSPEILQLQKGISFVRGLCGGITDETGSREENIRRLKDEIRTDDAIVIGEGAGLSTAAGFTYSGERFDRYFFDFKERFGIRDMYSGGFYPFPDEETLWAWWARHIYFNRYIDAPNPVYQNLFSLVGDRDYFVITTNVDLARRDYQ